MGNFINASPVIIDFEFNSRVRKLYPGEPFLVTSNQDYLINEVWRPMGVLPYNSGSNLDSLYSEGLNLFVQFVDENITKYAAEASKLRDEKLSRPVILNDEEKRYIDLRNKIVAGKKKGLSGLELFKSVYKEPIDFERGMIEEISAIDKLRKQYQDLEKVTA